MLNEIRLHGIMVNSQTSPSCAEEVTTMVTLTENPPSTAISYALYPYGLSPSVYPWVLYIMWQLVQQSV